MWTTSSLKHTFSWPVSLYNHLSLQNSIIRAEPISISWTNPSVVELLHQQEALQKDTTAIISMLSELQTQHKNDNFLVDSQMYDAKGDRGVPLKLYSG